MRKFSRISLQPARIIAFVVTGIVTVLKWLPVRKRFSRSGCTQCIEVCLHAAAEAVLFLFFSATTTKLCTVPVKCECSSLQCSCDSLLRMRYRYKLGFEHFHLIPSKKKLNVAVAVYRVNGP